MNGINNRGGLTPLLLNRQGLLAIGLAFLLSACSSTTPKLPEFTASGYIADEGVVRLWRLNNKASEPLVIMSVYSFYQKPETMITFYEYRQNRLWQIRSEILEPTNPSSWHLRLNKQGEVIFMQQETKGEKRPLNEDERLTMIFSASKEREISEALAIGKVNLVQGVWYQNKMTTCAGEKVNVSFETPEMRWLEKRTQHSTKPAYVAWLDSPDGNQLLMVAEHDFCKWEPTKESL